MPLHRIIAGLAAVIAWKWGDWRNWRLYYSTMLFFASGNLIYNFLFYNRPLWLHKSPTLPHTLLELIWMVVFFPCTLLLYLPYYPKKIGNQTIYIGTWVLGYILLEYMLYSLGYFTYKNGWNIWWSVLFDCFMFPVLRLHHTRPLWALFFSGIFLIIMLKIFNITSSIIL